MNKFRKKYLVYIRAFTLFLIVLSLTTISTFIFLYFPSIQTIIGFFLISIFISYFMFAIFYLLKAREYHGEFVPQINQFLEKNNFLHVKLLLLKNPISNATTMGFLNSKAIIFTCSLLEAHSFNEIRGVLAHELGHFRNKDIIIYTFLVPTVISLISYTNISLFSTYFTNSFSSSVLIFLPESVILLLVGLSFSRYREHLADKYAKKILENPHDLADFFKRVISEHSKEGITISEKPGWFEKILFTHPGAYTRIKFLNK